MRKLILLFSMKRSGQHGVIHWIAKQHGKMVHFNNCVVYGENRKTMKKKHRRSLEGSRVLGHHPIFYDLDNIENKSESKNIGDFLLDKKYKDYSVICNFEDMSPRFDRILEILPLQEINCKIYKVLLLRDPYNLFCSRKSLNGSVRYSRNDIWVEHAKLFNGCNDIIKVNFNKWHVNKEYRKNISRLLNIEFTDLGKEEMYHKNSDSTFDKKKFDGKANQMDLLNRWKKCSKDEGFLSILRKDDIVELETKCFDMKEARNELQSRLSKIRARKSKNKSKSKK